MSETTKESIKASTKPGSEPASKVSTGKKAPKVPAHEKLSSSPTHTPAQVKGGKGRFDDAYVEIYCESPHLSKSECIRQAGYVGPYARQEAWRTHDRNRARIEQILTDRLQDLGMLGYKNLRTMLEKAPDEIGFSNALATVRAAMDYAGRRPGDKLTITKEQSIEEIEAELAALEREERDSTRH